MYTLGYRSHSAELTGVWIDSTFNTTAIDYTIISRADALIEITKITTMDLAMVKGLMAQELVDFRLIVTDDAYVTTVVGTERTHTSTAFKYASMMQPDGSDATTVEITITSAAV